MSISEAKSSIPATEFVRWLAFFEADLRRTSKQDYYAAQISYTVWMFLTYFATWVGDKDFELKSLKDFLLEFEDSGTAKGGEKKFAPKTPPMPSLPDVIDGMPREDWERLKKSESHWSAVMGMAIASGAGERPKNPPPPPKKPDKESPRKRGKKGNP